MFGGYLEYMPSPHLQDGVFILPLWNMQAKRKHPEIIIVAEFILFSIKKYGPGPYYFPKVSEELGLSKQQIISIFNLFQKAKLIQFTFIPWDPQDADNFEFRPTQKIIESRTDGFALADWSIFLKIGREPMPAFDAKKHRLPKLVFKEEELKEIASSEKGMGVFLNKYGRYYNKEITPHKDASFLSFEQLSLNIDTGEFSYFKDTGFFSVNSQEFKLLKALLTNSNNLTTYDELVGIIYPAITKANKISKPKIHTIVNHIKSKLNISKGGNKNGNKNIFQTVTNYGYRLVK